MKETETAGGIVLNRGGEVLVVDQQGTSWSLPKGHLEEGENAREAAVREIQEESGLTQLTYVRDLGSYQRYKISLDGGDDMSELKTITLFLFKTDQYDLKPLDTANQEARWVPKEKVEELLTHRKDKEFYRSVLNNLSD